MHLRPLPVDIPDDEPLRDDRLRRKPFIVGLTQLIRASTSGAVLAIDAPWGEGKTYVAKALATDLLSDSYRVVLYDAFERDFIEDGPVGIMASIITVLEEGKSSEPAAYAGLVEASKGLLRRIGTAALNAAIRTATQGLVNASDLSDAEMADATSKAISSSAEAMIEEQLSAAKSATEALQEFRKALSEAAKSQAKENRPLVVIVDELDRCRPSHAVRVLESIKHLFSVQHVVFVLFIHHEQLSNAVKGVYGSHTQADEYLRKFIDLRIMLPELRPDPSRNDLEAFVGALIHRFDITQIHRAAGVPEAILDVARSFRISLRDIERIFGTCVAMAAISPNTSGYPYLTAVSVSLMIVAPSLFEALRFGDTVKANGLFIETLNNRMIQQRPTAGTRQSPSLTIMLSLTKLSSGHTQEDVYTQFPDSRTLLPSDTLRQLPRFLNAVRAVVA